jgi:hypothetical protein
LEFLRKHGHFAYHIAAFLIPFVVYSSCLRYYDYTYGFNILATQFALWKYHSFSVAALTQSVAPGNIPNVDTILYNGRYYVAYAPGIVLLAYPFSVVGFLLDAGRLLTQGNAIVMLELFVALCGALGSFMVYKLCLLYSSRVSSLLASLVLAFGTSAWPFASVVFPHDVTMFLSISSVYCIMCFLRRKSRSRILLPLAAICLGLASLTDYVITLLIVPIIAYLIFLVATEARSPRSIHSDRVRPDQSEPNNISGHKLTKSFTRCIGSFIDEKSSALSRTFQNSTLDSEIEYSQRRLTFGAILLFVVLFFITGPFVALDYNYSIFGNPFTFPEEYFQYVPLGQRNLGGLGARFRVEAMPMQAMYNLFSPYRGLLILSPVLIFGVFGLYLMLTRGSRLRSDALFLIALFLSVFLPYSAWNDWAGGAAYGPRFLVTALPFLVIPMSQVFARWKNDLKGGLKIRLIAEAAIFYLLFGVSMFTQGIGALTTATPHLIYPPPILVYQPSVEAIPDLFNGKYGVWWMERFGIIGHVQDTSGFTVFLFTYILSVVGYLIYRAVVS